MQGEAQIRSLLSTAVDDSGAAIIKGRLQQIGVEEGDAEELDVLSLRALLDDEKLSDELLGILQPVCSLTLARLCFVPLVLLCLAPCLAHASGHQLRCLELCRLKLSSI